MTSYRKILLFALLFAAVLGGCKDRWEEHIKVSDQALQGSVLEQISGRSELSKFHDFIKRTGYDQLLASSKSFTVWAPTDEALQSMDQDIVKDEARLKQFVANHIAYLQYFSNGSMADSARIKTLSGKYVAWQNQKTMINEATVAEGDIFAGNGVLHVISSPLTPKVSSWEYLVSSNYARMQAEFMQELQGEIFVDSIAPKIGVDPNTGEPVYDTLAGMVPYNPFFNRAYDISNEDSVSTFIMLTDEAFEAEINKFRKYYKTGGEDSTLFFTAFGVVKDLAFRGLYLPENLPHTLMSKDSVPVHISSGDIVHVEKTSNGIVYILDNINIDPQDKLRPIVVQGEWAYDIRQEVISHPEQAGSLRWRNRRSPEFGGLNPGEIFQDLRAYDHGISNFHIRYDLEEVNSTTYKVYWVTYNDFNGEIAFTQKLAFKSPIASDAFSATVEPNQHIRKYLGEYTVENYGDLEVFLVGANSNTASENALTLDYFEMIPVAQ